MESIPEDHVGLVFEDRFQQERVIARVVFEVSVLDQDDIASGLRYACPDRRAFSAIHLVPQQPDLPRRQALQQVRRAVSGGVVHHDDLAREVDGRLEDVLDHGDDRLGFVVDGHHHRQRHGHNDVSRGKWIGSGTALPRERTTRAS